MGYDSSASKREFPTARTNTTKKKHGLSSADIKFSDTLGLRAPTQSNNQKKETVLTTKRQLRNALAQQKRSLVNECNDSTAVAVRRKGILLTTKRQLKNALASAQKTGSVTAKTNKLEKRQKTNRVGAKKAGDQSRESAVDRSSKVQADQTLTSNVDRNVQGSALYIIRKAPARGFGLFAARDIRRGSRILADKPFFSLTKRPVISLSDPRAPNDISKAFDRLSVSDQRQYLDLYCPLRPGLSRGISIYEANCYEMGAGTCICTDASRINHSCVPNAHYSWNCSIKRITVHAVKDIPQNEEITISYCSGLRSFEERQRELEPYVFVCNCPACRTDTDFGSKSRIRRRQMRDLAHRIAAYHTNPLPAARIGCDDCEEESAILRLIELIGEEGLVYEKSAAYHGAAECALKRGVIEEALGYASRELDVVFCCVGRDSPYYEETVAFVQSICSRANDEASKSRW